MNLLNGQSGYKFDEKTYISMSKSDRDKDKGDWFKLIKLPLFNQLGLFTFDYEYLLQKYDLINKRNKNLLTTYGF